MLRGGKVARALCSFPTSPRSPFIRQTVLRRLFGQTRLERERVISIGIEVIRWLTRIRRRLHGGGDEVIIEKRGGVGVRIDIVGGGRDGVMTWVPKGGSCSHMPLSMMTPPHLRRKRFRGVWHTTHPPSWSARVPRSLLLMWVPPSAPLEHGDSRWDAFCHYQRPRPKGLHRRRPLTGIYDNT